MCWWAEQSGGGRFPGAAAVLTWAGGIRAAPGCGRGVGRARIPVADGERKLLLWVARRQAVRPQAWHVRPDLELFVGERSG